MFGAALFVVVCTLALGKDSQLEAITVYRNPELSDKGSEDLDYNSREYYNPVLDRVLTAYDNQRRCECPDTNRRRRSKNPKAVILIRPKVAKPSNKSIRLRTTRSKG